MVRQSAEFSPSSSVPNIVGYCDNVEDNLADFLVYNFDPFSDDFADADDENIEMPIELFSPSHSDSAAVSTQASNDIIADQSLNFCQETETEAISVVSLTFDANFECGNLKKASRVFGRRSLMNTRHAAEMLKDVSIPEDVHQEYDLCIRNDINTSGNIQWYYFSASTPASSQCTYPIRIRFNIVNMQKKDALYNYGMRPATYSVSDARDSDVGWIHAGYDICYYKNGRTTIKNKESKKKLCYLHSLSFTYTFNRPDTVFFAHCYPYTYTTLRNYLNSISSNSMYDNFCKRRLLSLSVCGNRCDLITVTESSNDPQKMAARKVIVITSRVHPGESNASHMMQGVHSPSSRSHHLTYSSTYYSHVHF